ncbi:vascular endothelial growth factor receptor 1-like [Anopheles albimanus]|uniref:vascular endothelial growth factor receptor 1-like n=1 Tax=Anopheles albimanus TaxID=7167 RepID=UPI00163DED51|nr:vascular endothelial growth factor receptor 1-like [Anopheles albimanus]
MYNMTVYVHDKPSVEMESKFADQSDQAIEFSCNVTGYPLPQVEFRFQPCPEVPWESCSEKPTTLIEFNQTTQVKHTTDVHSIVKLTATQPGTVYCIAVNAEGNATATGELMIANITKQIALSPVTSHELVTIGDNVTFVCRALKFIYSNDFRFEFNGSNIHESHGTNIYYTSDLLIWSAYLTIKNVSLEQSGNIACRVKLQNNSDDHVNIPLEVLTPWDPRVLTYTSEIQNVTINMLTKVNFTCDVHEITQPTFIWLKNGEIYDWDGTYTPTYTNRTSLTITHPMPSDSGLYECVTKNDTNSTKKSWNLSVRMSMVNVSSVSLIFSVLMIFVLVICVSFLVFFCKKKKEVAIMKAAGLVNFEEGGMNGFNPAVALHEQAELLPYDTDYEFPKERIKFSNQLGQGAFGIVMKATASNIMVHEEFTTVAVKMVKHKNDNQAIRALVLELKIMIHLGQHLNVVNLLGAVTKNIAKRELMVILEYCPYGSVQSILQKNREHFIDQINPQTDKIEWQHWTDFLAMRNSANSYTFQKNTDSFHNDVEAGLQTVSEINHSEYLEAYSTEDMVMLPMTKKENHHAQRIINTTDLVCWAAQIATGMDYLASRKVVHGDLATRNVLLSHNNVVKICDFGLARSIYRRNNYKKKGEDPLPFKWLALECISDNVFSLSSDVWAYGIVLWELFSLAQIPYPGFDANEQLYHKLRDGYRMDKPQYANQNIYDLMLNCWYVNPEARPSFYDLKCHLNGMVPEELKDHYWQLNESYLAMNTMRKERNKTDYFAHLGPPDERAPAIPD